MVKNILSSMQSDDESVTYRSIGRLHTPFTSHENMPIQSAASTTKGMAILYSAYEDALEGLEGFSHAILLYCFHKSAPYRSKVTPFLDDRPMGLFATRAPCRPNPLGMSIVRIESIRGTTISFEGADMLDGTPLLDIKPYVTSFDAYPNARDGWLSNKKDTLAQTQSDRRFT